MVRYLVSFAIIILCSLGCSGQQLPTGAWRYYPCYAKTSKCAATVNFVYASSERGLFRVKRGIGEITRLTKADGFHATEITSLDFYANRNILLIGYIDGYIELVKNENEIIGIPGFYNNVRQGDKSIIHCSFNDKFAYISTHFGILEIDLELNEIKNSYTSITANTTSQDVLSTTIVGDTIFAGLPDGIIAAGYNKTVNLNDNSNWRRVYKGKAANHLTFLKDSLFFYADSVAFKYFRGTVSALTIPGKSIIVGVKNYFNKLEIFRQGNIFRMDENGIITNQYVNIISSGTVDNDGRYWFTTSVGDGVVYISPTDFYSYNPNGPASLSVFAMTKNGELLFVTGGGVTNTFGNAFNIAGFYIYNNVNWNNNPVSVYNTNLYDYTYTTYNQVTDKYYVATHTNGLLEFKGTIATNKFDENNSTLERNPGVGFIRVSGLAADADGNLWVSNYGASNSLHVLSKKGIWTAISLTENGVKNLTIDNNGYKWMIIQSGGVLVFDDNKTPGNLVDDRYIKLTTSHGLITNEVYSLASDKSGFMWIGTSQGLNVVTNTYDVFKRPKVDRFVIEQNGAVGYLLGEETINDICVDGGDRKWIATNNGAYLVEPGGQQVVAQFKSENSPLLNNKILCIGQISNTGEVFFGTNDGIVSYRSDASEADQHFKNIKIYPNPVKPGYTGLVTIEGLAQDADIRITDAAGLLVYQTKANGGTATWPCTRLNGSRPNSGVYYVFGINKDGTETAMGKFIFIK